jgi:hypothetical protein
VVVSERALDDVVGKTSKIAITRRGCTGVIDQPLGGHDVDEFFIGGVFVA